MSLTEPDHELEVNREADELWRDMVIADANDLDDEVEDAYEHQLQGEDPDHGRS